jgi:hypothetical protein
MKLKLIKPVVINGHPGVAVGDVFECVKNPHLLIADGYVVEVKESKEEIQTREPVVENRDPKPKKQKAS